MSFAHTRSMFIVIGLLFHITRLPGVCLNEAGVSVDPSTGPVIPWATEFHQVSAVVIGKVVSEKQLADPQHAGDSLGISYQLRVETTLKGRAMTAVNVFSPNDSGRVLLAEGKRYLLFLSRRDDRWTVNACGNSAKLVPPFE